MNHRKDTLGGGKILAVAAAIFAVTVVILVWKGIGILTATAGASQRAAERASANRVLQADIAAFEAAREQIAVVHTRMVDSCAEPSQTESLPPTIVGAAPRQAQATIPTQLKFFAESGFSLSVAPQDASERTRAFKASSLIEYHRFNPLLADIETSLPLLVIDTVRLEATAETPAFSTKPVRLRTSLSGRLPIGAPKPAQSRK